MTKLVKGGQFLVEETDYKSVFTPEDFSDEQKMVANTAEQFAMNDVLPLVEKLENHEFEHSVKLMRQAGE